MQEGPPSHSKDNIFLTIFLLWTNNNEIMHVHSFSVSAFQQAQRRNNFMNMYIPFSSRATKAVATDFLQFVSQCGLILLCDLTLFCLFVCPVLDAM